MEAAARAAGLETHTAADIPEAIVRITARLTEPARVLIAGSHLLLAEAIRANTGGTAQWLDHAAGGHYCAH